MIADDFGVNESRFLTDLDKQGKVSIRMNTAYTLQPGTSIEEALKLVKANEKSTSNLVTNKSVKMFYDGVTEGGSALMLEPYTEAAGMGSDWYGGDSIWPKEEFKQMVIALDKCRLSAHREMCQRHAARRVAEPPCRLVSATR